MSVFEYTLSTIRTEVQDFMNDPDGNRYSDTSVDRWTNMAQHQVFRDTLMEHETNVAISVAIADIKEVTDAVIVNVSDAATAIGDTVIKITATWGTVAADAYADKYLSVDDTAGTTESHLITSHTVATTYITFTLREPIRVALITTSSTATIKPTPARYALDSTNASGFCGVVRKVEYNDGDGYDTLEHKNYEDMDLRYWDARDSTGTVSYYWFSREGSTWYINLWYVPAESGTLRIYYYKAPDTLSSDTDVSEVHIAYHPAIVLYAKYLALQTAHRFTEARDVYGEYRIVMAQASANTIVETTGGHRTVSWSG